MKEKNPRVSVTLAPAVKGLCDSILTPPGLLTPPVGSYPQFISSLITEHIERLVGADIFDIIEYSAGRDLSIAELAEHFQE